MPSEKTCKKATIPFLVQVLYIDNASTFEAVLENLQKKTLEAV